MSIERIIQFRRPAIVGVHLLLVPLVYAAAFLLRFDQPLPQQWVSLFWLTVPVLVVLRLAAFTYFRLFQGWWRHVGMQDLADLFKAVTLSSLVFLCVLFAVGEFRALPRSILVLDWMLAMMVFGGSRFAVRSAREGRVTRRRSVSGKRTLVVGAGETADNLLRQLSRNETDRFHPVALVDDDRLKHGMRLHGVQVLGGVADMGRIVREKQIQQVVIAIPSATQEQMQHMVGHCMETGLEFRIVPRLDELIDGRARLGALRKVEIDDLLGRPPVSLKLKEVDDDLQDQVVLITGGAGSIGSELARQIARRGPAKLVLVEQAESALYFIHLELTKAHPELEVVPVIADITDAGRLEGIFSRFKPDFVFHAAAYKHVPLMEMNVIEAVRNNVLGTLGVAECAARHGVRKFVLISTDKAVRPSSVMGATKRIAERIVLGLPTLRRSATDFRAVRFGNVLGSDGSVIPLFKKQLAAGQPLTVTHPDVTRYFMTIPEAAQLVLQAASLPEAAGRISMLEMGEPVRVVELAENLIRLSGLEPYRDVAIVFSGLRPGEKLHEELMSDVEQTVPTTVEKICVVQTDEPDQEAVRRGLERLAAAAAMATSEDILSALRAMVPECVAPLQKPEWTAPRFVPVQVERRAERREAIVGPRPRFFSVDKIRPAKPSASEQKIYLSSPHMSGEEQKLVTEAFATNWIAPLGPHVDGFEAEFCRAVGAKHAAALSSGTAALHLALKLVGVSPGDEVMVSTLTFSASVNPILYLGARPVFIDSDRTSWNMDPALLEEELERRARSGRLPRAVVVVHLYGQSADMDPIMEVCDRYGVAVVEDAAEALGSTYRGRTPGTIGKAGIYSFNGNKIITTSGGGMLVSDDEELIVHARKLATQARDAAPHYQHSEVGYNYRMSNVLAGIGRGQLRALEERVQARRKNFEFYCRKLAGLPGVEFMPESTWGRHTRWLTCLTIDPAEFGADREQVRLALEAENIEARPVWKPMHLQPIFGRYPVVGGGVAESLFENGLCLPSGSNLRQGDLARVVGVVEKMAGARVALSV